MSKKKKKIIIIGAIFLTILAVFLFLKQRQAPSLPSEKEPLNLLEIFPSEGKQQALFSSTAILFTFDAPLVLSTVNVSIDPKIEIVAEAARNSSAILAIRPVEEWEKGVSYTIVIKKGLASVNNKELKGDITYKIEFEYPTDVIHY